MAVRQLDKSNLLLELGRSRKGFFLWEVVLALAVMSLVIATAVPGLQRMALLRMVANGEETACLAGQAVMEELLAQAPPVGSGATLTPLAGRPDIVCNWQSLPYNNRNDLAQLEVNVRWQVLNGGQKVERTVKLTTIYFPAN